MQNFRALEPPPPDFRATGRWRLCPQTPSLRRLGSSLPDFQWSPEAGAPLPDPQNSPLHCEFLATRLLTYANVKTWFKFDLQINRAERAGQFKNFLF